MKKEAPRLANHNPEKKIRFNGWMTYWNSVYQKRSTAKYIGDGRKHDVRAGKLGLT